MTAKWLIAGLVLTACSKPAAEDKPAPSASQASASPSVRDAGSATPTASAAPQGAAASYGGTYSVAPASFYIPAAKDYASVKQVKDDPSKHVGDGALTVGIAADGRVSGTIDAGPAGPAVIDGMKVGDEIRGTVRRKDPSDDGLTGTLSGKVSGDAIEGTLALAEAHAAIVREGKFTLKKR